METLLDHGAKRMITREACEYCQVEEKILEFEKDETTRNFRTESRSWSSCAYKKIQESAFGCNYKLAIHLKKSRKIEQKEITGN